MLRASFCPPFPSSANFQKCILPAPAVFVFPPSTSSLTPCNTFYLYCFPKSAPTVKNNCLLSEVLTLPSVSHQNLMHSLQKLSRLWPSTPGHFQGQAIRLQMWWASPPAFTSRCWTLNSPRRTSAFTHSHSLPWHTMSSLSTTKTIETL